MNFNSTSVSEKQNANACPYCWARVPVWSSGAPNLSGESSVVSLSAAFNNLSAFWAVRAGPSIPSPRAAISTADASAVNPMAIAAAAPIAADRRASLLGDWEADFCVQSTSVPDRRCQVVKNFDAAHRSYCLWIFLPYFSTSTYSHATLLRSALINLAMNDCIKESLPVAFRHCNRAS